MKYKVKDLVFDCSTCDSNGNSVGLTGIIFDGCIEGPNGFFSTNVEEFLQKELEEVYNELNKEEKIENLKKQIEVIKRDIKICEKVLDTLQDTPWVKKYQKFKQGKIQLIHELKLFTNELALLEKESIHCNKQCSYNNHCMCAFECASFMLYDGCKNLSNDSDLDWSVQAERDFIG